MPKKVKAVKPLRHRVVQGRLIGWKKVLHPRSGNELLAKLSIPANADVVRGSLGTYSSNTDTENKKHRASKAKVLQIFKYRFVWDNREYKLGRRIKNAISAHDMDFKYAVGKVVKPQQEFDRSRKICTSGIHFFLDLQEAGEYSI